MKRIVFVLLLLVPTAAWAGTEKVWKPLERGQIPEGEALGAAPVSDGSVRLAPQVEELAQIPVPYLWGVVRAGKTVYAAGGDSGVVYRLTQASDPTKRAVPAYAASAIGVNAITTDGKNVIIGTSPDGKVLRLDKAKKTTELFDPEEKYIWSVTTHGDSLYVAAGTPGRVYRVPRKGGKGVQVFDGESHIRSLAVESSGSVLAGSDGRGLLIRLPKAGAAGKPFVLYDAPRREVSDIAVGKDGVVFFAAVGDEADPSADPASGPTALLFRMERDGFVEQLWEAPGPMIYALAVAPDGKVWVATGNPGGLYVVSRDGVASRIWEAEAKQVTDLAVTPDGLVASTGNPAKLVRIPWHAGAVTGEFLGKPLDAGGFARWGRLNLNASLAGGSLQVLTRSGNTEEPDDTWSAWSNPIATAGGEVKSPPARYLQWKVKLTGSAQGEPVLRYLEVFYQTANRAPKVTEITIEEPGLTLRPKPRLRDEGEPPGVLKENPSEKGWEPGFQALQWTAEDPDEDTLVYDVEIRALGTQEWTPLVQGQLESYYTFDATAVADGRYEVRVVARDDPSNVKGKARRGEKVEGPITVDTTPPSFREVVASAKRGRADLRFDAGDQGGGIARAEVSVGGGEWILVEPQDGLSDEANESYQYALENLPKGTHTVVVRVTDRSGNSAVSQTRVTVR